MSQQQVSSLIQNILGQENNLRQQSETEIQNSVKSHPNELFSILIDLLKNSPQTDIRSFCAIFLRKNLSSFSEKSFDCAIKKLNPNVLELIQNSLFQYLQIEQERFVRHQICDAIAEIAATLYDLQCEWPNFVQTIFQLLQQNNLVLIDCGLRILKTVFEFESTVFLAYKNDLYLVFQTGLSNADLEINNSSILALAQFVMAIDPKEGKQFEQLMPQILETSMKLLKKSDCKYGEDVLSTLADIADAEPKFFKASFSYLHEFVRVLVYDKNFSDPTLKEIAINILISIVERIPALVKKDKEKLKGIILMLFHEMVSIDSEIDEEWIKPLEGFKEDHENGEVENDEVHFGMQGIDRLISSIGEKVMLPVLGTVVQELVVHQDWRYKNAAIMALSQVGEYIDEVKEVKPICDMVLGFAQNPNPKIRYAVCHFMGQISDDMQPKIQEIYSQQVFESIFKLLSDPIPRVVGHAAACLSNFVEGMTQESLEPYLLNCMQKFFEILTNSCSFVKESVITAVSSFADTSRLSFVPYYQKAVEFLFQMMETHQQKEYQAIRGLIIECLTIIGQAVEYDNFKLFADKIITIMLQIQNSSIDPTDTIKSYLLSGWQRICVSMGKSFQPYLKMIIPSTFALLNKVFVVDQGSQAACNIQTYDTEEATIAINMLSVIIDEMDEHMIEYIQPILQIIVPLCNYSTNGDLRSSSVQCLSGLVKAQNKKDSIAAQILCKQFITILFQASEEECFTEIIKDQIYAMKDCLEIIDSKFLQKSEIDGLSVKIFKLMQDSEARKQENENIKKVDEDLEEEDIQEIDDGNLEEDSLYVALGELMGALFKTHKELTLGMVEQLYNNVLSGALQSNQSEIMHKFAIFVVVDMIEFLGIELIPDKWPHLLDALLRFSSSKSCQVRQAAAYGIGVLSEKSQQVFAPLAPACINKLYEALSVPMGAEKPKVYGHCKDNIVSALGKIIKTNQLNQNDLKAVIQKWLEQLPLKHDKPEAKFNHELLVDIMLMNQQIIVQDNIQNVFFVIKVYAQVLQTKYSDASIDNKIKTSLKQLCGYSEIQQNWTTIISDLDAQQKNKLEKFLNS